MSDIKTLRNIAIIAHVDHGKTTLVDKLLQQSGALGDRSGEIESERGITILAKNTAIKWLDARTNTEYRINIVDTPGHADFGGEVERVMSMVDCVLLLVDSQEGPMPQTRFVTQKAFARGLKPIVIINKVDKPSARPDWVIDQVFDLFDNLSGSDEQLDFPVVYASGHRGVAGPSPEELAEDMTPLFQTIVDIVEPPAVDVDGPFQMQISSLDYNSFVGVIGVGRIQRGSVGLNTQVTVIDKEGKTRNGRILKIMGYHGLERVDVDSAQAGDIVCITGRGELHLSVLIENMRREGFEMGVSRPQVILKEVDGEKQEPYENVTFDVEEQHQGSVMEQMGHRKGEMTNMEVDGKGRIRIEATVPSRGLIGFRSEFLTMTSGTEIMTSSFSHYGPMKQGTVAKRQNGVLISMVQGTCLGYALFTLQDRGRLFAKPQLEVYEGMIIGINSRSDDMTVNPTKAKQLTNVRASGTDDALTLVPAVEYTLEQALEFIEDDELVEVTPKSIRIRKRYLTENERKRNRSGK